jgi:hypothetical protein
MSKKGSKAGGDPKTPVVTTLAVTGGVFVMRKLLATVWQKTTGKTPPTDLTDPRVNLVEVLAWSVATGLIIETLRFLVIRNTVKRPAVDVPDQQ